jgi:hypothetical protein
LTPLPQPVAHPNETSRDIAEYQEWKHGTRWGTFELSQFRAVKSFKWSQLIGKAARSATSTQELSRLNLDIFPTKIDRLKTKNDKYLRASHRAILVVF